ncbi:MAG TPA: DUF72 domain-containing protein, partial [Myxococcota bacterium]|nr:DUF72 domain-containing protein [Myxococcota bacterium]
MRWRVGTSGFSYDEWTGSFYPEELPGSQRLAYYAARLPAVEINNTFYRMPKAAVLEGWAAQAGPGFRFALKAPRRITHAKASDDVGDSIAHLFRVSTALGESGGPVLFQLPPWARKDVARLRGWLAAAPAGRPVALEVRHPSWLDDEVFGALRDAGAALCAADFDEPERAVPLLATARFGYLRLRAADYDDAALRRWADEIAAQPWDEAYVFFKHEDAGAAPRLAARLLALATG